MDKLSRRDVLKKLVGGPIIAEYAFHFKDYYKDRESYQAFQENSPDFARVEIDGEEYYMPIFRLEDV